MSASIYMPYVPPKTKSSSGTGVRRVTKDDVDRITEGVATVSMGPIASQSPLVAIFATNASLYTWGRGNSAIKKYENCLDNEHTIVNGAPTVFRGASEGAWHVPKDLVEGLLAKLLPNFSTLPASDIKALEVLAKAIGSNVPHLVTYMLLVANATPVGGRNVKVSVIDEVTKMYVDPETRKDLDADGVVSHIVFKIIGPIMPKPSKASKASKATPPAHGATKHVRKVVKEEAESD